MEGKAVTFHSLCEAKVRSGYGVPGPGDGAADVFDLVVYLRAWF